MPGKTALIVIDMQNDYLYEKRKAKFAYDTAKLTAAVNEIIHNYKDSGSDVIYIRHIIQNLPTNRLLFGYSIDGTEGAELYSGLDIVSDECFDKLLGDPDNEIRPGTSFKDLPAEWTCPHCGETKEGFIEIEV